MNEVSRKIDYLASEIGTIIGLCEWIDRLSDAEVLAALPNLHRRLHAHLDDLVEGLREWRVQNDVLTLRAAKHALECGNCVHHGCQSEFSDRMRKSKGRSAKSRKLCA